jgi:arabinose-5-phosphate isomerase
LSSTGTPAFFVHPGEASHGDLGVISENDSVLLLSNSGETSELKAIINYCQRFNIPTISIVRRQKSYLVKTSDVSLILPDSPEANDINAPTTSTTMMMVLGDLLAVCLLKRKNFDGDAFNIFHPGGKLGSSFLKVKNLMHVGEDLPLIHSGASMKEAITIMTDKALGCIAVLNKSNQMLGVITDGDLRRHIFESFANKKVDNFMTANPVTISDDDLASKALNIMETKSITNLFVVENGCAVGVIHIHDILKAGVI